MLQPRLRGTVASARDHSATFNHLVAAFDTLTLCSKHAHLKPQISSVFVRHASHAAQGRANGPKDSAGRRLGAKKTASQYVIPGNIIFKQRGTKWFPGENVDMGKDHTIYATQYGYVRYYKNPALHPKRQYIGVALEKEGPGSKLPTPANAPTRRLLGMYEAPISGQSDEEFLQGHLSENSKGPRGEETAPTPTPAAKPVGAGMIKTYANKPGTPWPTNYELGRAGERNAGLVRPFDRKDRWLAWRKRSKRVKEGLLAKAAKATRKTKGKKSNKGAATSRK